MRTSLFILLVLTGCSATSAGGGTGTLYVLARLTSDGSSADSRARVTVREGGSTGELVSDATVVVRRPGAPALTPAWDERGGWYETTGFEWPTVVRLEITRGQDWLDASLELPGTTLITNPIGDSTVKRSEPLIIRWKDAQNRWAEDVHVRLQRAELDRALPANTVELRLEANELEVTDQERVRVERGNDVSLFGGAEGSVLSATTEHSLSFQVE